MSKPTKSQLAFLREIERIGTGEVPKAKSRARSVCLKSGWVENVWKREDGSAISQSALDAAHPPGTPGRYADITDIVGATLTDAGRAVLERAKDR